MLFQQIADTSVDVAATRSRNAKRDAIAQCLRRLNPDEIPLGISYLAGMLPQGRIGVGPAALSKSARQPPAGVGTVGLRDLDRALTEIKTTTGKGSVADRQRLIAALFCRLTANEQRLLMQLLVGEVRQGALDGVMVEGIAAAWQVPAADVRRAHMLTGDLARVGRVAADKGAAGLREFRLALGVPVQSMLAQPAEGIEDALQSLGSAILDVKMDGARVQVHKSGSDIAVFSRRLNDVSASVPEVVETVAALPVRDIVLDGEVAAFDLDDRPLAFQETMRRFGRRQDVARMREALPLSVHFFDCVHAGGADLLDVPLMQRLSHIDDIVAEPNRMPRLATDDLDTARAFLARTLADGHEGLMAKDPESAYEAGNRGRSWLKVKQVHTLDLVVLAAEWGTGRRRGTLSNLHLGARDEATGQYVMLGKTFKGLTDAMLAWQTKALLDIEIGRDSHTVFVEPRLVVEIAFNDVQASPQYPAGMALRFARVKSYRADKAPSDADTLEKVRAIFAAGATLAGPPSP